MRSFSSLLAMMCALTVSGCAVMALPEADLSHLPPAHQAMLASDDPTLAANKKHCYDMYREVLAAGRTDLVKAYIVDDYIQHNPNAPSGRQALIDYIANSRPVREIEPVLGLPLIWITAEGDYVTMAFERPETDAEGRDYITTWFDLYRLEDGMIVEHWDPALRNAEMARVDPNEKTRQ